MRHGFEEKRGEDNPAKTGNSMLDVNTRGQGHAECSHGVHVPQWTRCRKACVLVEVKRPAKNDQSDASRLAAAMNRIPVPSVGELCVDLNVVEEGVAWRVNIQMLLNQIKCACGCEPSVACSHHSICWGHASVDVGLMNVLT